MPDIIESLRWLSPRHYFDTPTIASPPISTFLDIFIFDALPPY
jgi:hypothetical protein